LSPPHLAIAFAPHIFFSPHVIVRALAFPIHEAVSSRQRCPVYSSESSLPS
jgi:hypothetical protein